MSLLWVPGQPRLGTSLSRGCLVLTGCGQLKSEPQNVYTLVPIIYGCMLPYMTKGFSRHDEIQDLEMGGFSHIIQMSSL